MKVRSLVGMAVFSCAVALSAAAVPVREVSGVRMPEVSSVAGKGLRLNGMGMRKVHIFFEVLRRRALPRKSDDGRAGGDYNR
jgi:hypothetical protein